MNWGRMFVCLCVCTGLDCQRRCFHWFLVWHKKGVCVCGCVHLFLLVIGVVIFIWAEFGATAIFRCDVIKPRAVNCFALIVDVAIVGTLRGLCC